MLTASRPEHTTAAMGVYQQQQTCTSPANVVGVYSAFSDHLRTTPNDSDNSDNEILEKSGLNSSPTENSPLPFRSAPEDADEGQIELVNPLSVTQTPCVRPKHGTTIIGLPSNVAELQMSPKEKPKKKKKWRAVGAEDMGFKLTLFPRPATVAADEKELEKEEAEFFVRLEAELDCVTVNDKVQPFLQLEGSGLAKNEKFVRKDRDRRVEKAHKQVKSKNITSVLNNKGRKTFYIHFRLYKIRTFLHCSNLEHPNLPSPSKRGGVCLDVARSAVKAQRRAVEDGWGSGSTSRGRRRPPAPQNLAHALDNNNAAGDLPTDILSFLINLQHREMTPEDYEQLLRLDDGVAPKTVSEDIVGTLKTDVVDESSVGEVCSVCMEVYEVGQQRKFLPCEHVFHLQCIDMWLTNSSQNCPLDGLPIGDS